MAEHNVEKKSKDSCEEVCRETTQVPCITCTIGKKGNVKKSKQCVSFPHCDINPGLVTYFQTLTLGQCVWIIPKNAPLTFYVGTYAGFHCGNVILENAFSTVTLVGAILAGVGVIPPLTPPLVARSFAGVINISVCDISSSTILNGDLCTFLNSLISTGTITVNAGTALIATFAPQSLPVFAALT